MCVCVCEECLLKSMEFLCGSNKNVLMWWWWLYNSTNTLKTINPHCKWVVYVSYVSLKLFKKIQGSKLSGVCGYRAIRASEARSWGLG